MRAILIASLFLLPISAFAATAVHHPNHLAARVRPHPLHHMRMSAGAAVHHPAIVHHPAERLRPHPLHHMQPPQHQS
jgi:hypothetical protein